MGVFNALCNESIGIDLAKNMFSGGFKHVDLDPGQASESGVALWVCASGARTAPRVSTSGLRRHNWSQCNKVGHTSGAGIAHLRPAQHIWSMHSTSGCGAVCSSCAAPWLAPQHPSSLGTFPGWVSPPPELLVPIFLSPSDLSGAGLTPVFLSLPEQSQQTGAPCSLAGESRVNIESWNGLC